VHVGAPTVIFGALLQNAIVLTAARQCHAAWPTLEALTNSTLDSSYQTRPCALGAASFR